MSVGNVPALIDKDKDKDKDKDLPLFYHTLGILLFVARCFG